LQRKNFEKNKFKFFISNKIFLQATKFSYSFFLTKKSICRETIIVP